MGRLGAAAAAVCVLALGACGSEADSRPAAPVTGAAGPSAATGASGPRPAATAPTPAAPVPPPSAPPPTATAAPTAPPAEPGGGDEEPIRQPARFVLGDDVTPSTISVAPFLAVELELVNRGDAPLLVRLVGTDVRVTVPAGGKATRRLPGLKRGMYTLSVNDGAQVASLVAGDDVGP